MRFTSIFTGLVAAASAVQAGVIGARVPSRGTSTQMTRRTMHEFAPRAVVGTVCANVGPISLPNLVGQQVVLVPSICLCTEAGLLTTTSLADLTAAITTGNEGGLVPGTVDVLVGLVLLGVQNDVADTPPSCDYPANSTPICASALTPGGCAFQCDPNFFLCNGQCVADGTPCATNSRKRDTTAAKTCPKSWAACPVFFGTHTTWECVDVAADLESCGGCATLEGQGVDCTTLPGVNDVICVAGQCQATTCLRGFTLDGSSTCVPDNTVKARRINLW